MPKARKEQKAELVDLLTEKLKKAKVAVLTDYRGLKVSQIQELRGKLRAADVEYRVVKNTLARRAAAESGLDALQAELVGPVGLAIGYADSVLTAKVVNDFIKQTRLLAIKGGLLGKQVLDADTVKVLAELPSRDALLGQLAGTLNHSVAQLAGAMQGAINKLASGLEAYRLKLEAAGAAQ